MARVNKNQRTALGNRNYMGHHEGDALNTLPKYNYSNGFGWRSHKRNNNAFGTSSIIRKVGGGVRIKVGN